MSPALGEAEVFLSLADWLDEQGNQFYVHVPDTHQDVSQYPHLLNQYPAHTISIGPYKPDQVGFTPPNRIFAIEVKGKDSLRKGQGQAISYQRGGDHAYPAQCVKPIVDCQSK